MGSKQESKLVIFVMLGILFISLLSPLVAAVVLLGIVIVFAIYKSKPQTKYK